MSNFCGHDFGLVCVLPSEDVSRMCPLYGIPEFPKGIASLGCPSMTEDIVFLYNSSKNIPPPQSTTELYRLYI